MLEVELKDDELVPMGVDEPVNYTRASNEHKWREVMKREMEGVMKNKTWDLTTLPRGQKPIDMKWIIILVKGYVHRMF